jgi:hypothetical protein
MPEPVNSVVVGDAMRLLAPLLPGLLVLLAQAQFQPPGAASALPLFHRLDPAHEAIAPLTWVRLTATCCVVLSADSACVTIDVIAGCFLNS